MSAVTRESCVLLTGATGLIGGEVLRALLDFGVQRIWGLVRAREGITPTRRIVVRMGRSGADLNGAADLVAPVEGDVARTGLGLSFDEAGRIRREIDFVIHCAGETSFVRAAECVSTNVVGMRNLIGFVHGCERNPVVVYVSTGTNGGALTDGCIREEQGCDPDKTHHNEYTRSKALAEQMLVNSGLPALVVRPSIVLSAGLPDRSFARAILWFVPLLRMFEALPVDPHARVDIVPIGFVARSIVALLALSERRWNCYHLSAGAEASPTCGQLETFVRRFYKPNHRLRLVAPREWTTELHRRNVSTAGQRKVFGALRHYLPFLNMNVVYDNTRLRTELGNAGIQIPRATEYIGDLLELVSGTEALEEMGNP